MEESARELLRNGVKDKLARNEVVLSMTVKLVRTVEIAGIARTAGFDSIYIDVEHSDRTAHSVIAGRRASCSRRKVSSVGRPLIYRVVAALPIPNVPYHRNV